MKKPMPLVIFQLKTRMERNTKMSIPKRRAMEQTMPVAVTGTGLPNTRVYISQGSGRLEESVKEWIYREREG